MDLNEKKEQKLQTLNELSDINKNIYPEAEITNNKNDSIAQNNPIFSKDEMNNALNNKENNLFYVVNTQKIFDENLILVNKIYGETCFLKLLNVKNENGKIILMYEKPYLTLLGFLLSKKEDIHSRFLLFKQSLEIIFRLISLDENFSFFNYEIFFVEESEIEENENLVFKNTEKNEHSYLKLKIYYHGKSLLF